MAASLDEAQVKNILRQVEFYFSDSNLPRDNFLKKTVQESNDGWKKIGSTTELPKPEVVIEQVDSRSVAASPLPHDVKIEDIEAFFGQHAKVNSVRLPRRVGDKRCFCGTALIEFSEEESVKKVLGKSLIYVDAELELKPKKDFDEEREKQREEFKKTRSDKNNSNGSYPKGLIVSFKLKSTEQVPEANENEEGKKIVQDGDEENVEMVAEDHTVDAKIKEKSAEDVEKRKVRRLLKMILMSLNRKIHQKMLKMRVTGLPTRQKIL